MPYSSDALPSHARSGHLRHRLGYYRLLASGLVQLAMQKHKAIATYERAQPERLKIR